MGGHTDIEEKFKKDISKELANLKEFLISQGKEIVKIKQENKAQKETKVGNGEGAGVNVEVKTILEKHSLALEKQKENTTKLSKLCLGTLNELEKFEKKQERETSTAPKNEDKMKRLGEENKKLIHLVTSLDQQVAMLEGKLNKNIFEGEELAKRVRHGSSDRGPKQTAEISREEVSKMIRETIPPAPSPRKEISKEEVVRMVKEQIQPLEEEATIRGPQIQSLVTEVPYIMEQVREMGHQFTANTDKVKKVEGIDTNEKFGLELAGALSRVEKLEREGAQVYKNKQQEAVLTDIFANRVDMMEQEVRKIEGSVGKIEQLDKKVSAELGRAVDRMDKMEEKVENMKQSENNTSNSVITSETLTKKLAVMERDLTTNIAKINSNEIVANEAKNKASKLEVAVDATIENTNTFKVSLDEAVGRLEDDGNIAKEAKRSVDIMAKELGKVNTIANEAKANTEDVLRQVESIKKEEEVARNTRKDQNILSAEDIKKDFVKFNEQYMYLDEKILKLTKSTDSASIETKSSCKKLGGELELLGEKVKNISLQIKEDKYKVEEKLSETKTCIEGMNNIVNDDLEKRLRTVAQAQGKIEKSSTNSEELARACNKDITNLRNELSVTKSCAEKTAKTVEENNSKIFECIHDSESLKESLDKLKKNVERRPAADEIDKKSEISNKLYNDLSAKIEDVDSILKKEVKKTRSDVEKTNKDLTNVQSKLDEHGLSRTKETKELKDEMSIMKAGVSECNILSKDFVSMKGDFENTSKDVKNIISENKISKTELKDIKVSVKSMSAAAEKVKCLEKDVDVLKKNQADGKFVNLEKDISSLRVDHEKLNIDIKGLSTEIKYCDSTLKKETTNTKAEIGAFSKTIKSIEKDIDTVHNMVDVISKDKDLSTNADDITQIKSDLSIVTKEIKDNITSKCKSLEDTLTKTFTTDIKDVELKIQKVKEEVSLKIVNCSNDITTLDKKVVAFPKGLDSTEVDKKIKLMKDDFNNSLKTTKEELTNKSKALENKLDSNDLKKGEKVEMKEIDNKIKSLKDEIMQKCKEDVTSKISLSDTKSQKIKDELTPKLSAFTAEQKALEKKIDSACQDIKKFGDLNTKMSKQEEGLLKLQKSVESMDSVKKSDKSGEELKKEIDKINQQIKESQRVTDGKISSHETKTNTLEGKVTSQETLGKSLETQIGQVKVQVKEATEKFGKLEKPDNTKTKSDDSLKKDIDNVSQTMTEKVEKINSQIKDCQKTLQDKIGGQDKVVGEKITQSQKVLTDKMSAQEKLVKEISDKIAKLEKSDSTTVNKTGGESAKLVTLSKAIDAIQENSKSLETMVKKMKTEFATPKDLDKLKTELGGKSGGGSIDPNHPDMGPIMDSLIMTNDRPYLDCSTVTPMTGTGLVKFERFSAINKLPWDDRNDQFIVQEPGVYAVFITAILQDAVLSVKIASNMLEREVCSVGSREGLVGCSAPTFVSRSGLLQIDDDENVAETILVEIHADNDDSFVDKNVTLTVYKIGETPGGE